MDGQRRRRSPAGRRKCRGECRKNSHPLAGDPPHSLILHCWRRALYLRDGARISGSPPTVPISTTQIVEIAGENREVSSSAFADPRRWTDR